jgi:cytochrome oxidase Cu insertion factor (SCO1/SenC/PrrC family)
MTLSPRTKLLLLFALFASPIVASLLTYRFYKPELTSNYGELLPPRPVTDQDFARAEGGAFRFESLRGKWVLVASDSGACAEACQAKLTTMRQVRLALGRNAIRVERVFVADDLAPPSPALAAEYPGQVVAVTPRGLTLPPGAGHDRAFIYLLDPRGDVMMRFPAQADSKRMLKDLGRLLKASQMG